MESKIYVVEWKEEEEEDRETERKRATVFWSDIGTEYRPHIGSIRII